MIHFGGGYVQIFFSSQKCQIYHSNILLTEYDIDIISRVILIFRSIKKIKKTFRRNNVGIFEFYYLRLFFTIVRYISAKMQYCTSCAFGFESSRDPRMIYVKERIIETPSVYVLFLLAIEENSTWPGEKRGWMRGRCQERGVGDWQAVHTRAICTTTIMWIRPRRVPAPFSIERKRTFAVRALGQWCARKRRFAFRLFPCRELRWILAGFFIRAKMQAGPIVERWF